MTPSRLSELKSISNQDTLVGASLLKEVLGELEDGKRENSEALGELEALIVKLRDARDEATRQGLAIADRYKADLQTLRQENEQLKLQLSGKSGELEEALKEATHQTDMGSQAAMMCERASRERDTLAAESLALRESFQRIISEIEGRNGRPFKDFDVAALRAICVNAFQRPDHSAVEREQ